MRLGFVLAFAAVCVGAPAAPPPPITQATLASARTFSIDVDQSCADAPGVSLPLREVVEFLLKAGGMTEISKGSGEVEVRVHSEAEAISGQYSDVPGEDPKTKYSGARMSGFFTVAGPAGLNETGTFSGNWDPPESVDQPYARPADAPFARTQWDFIRQFTVLAYNAFGPRAAEAVARMEDRDPLLKRAPQLLPCALFEIARHRPPDAYAQLLKALDSETPNRIAAAAFALRILGDSRAVPALLNRAGYGDEWLVTRDLISGTPQHVERAPGTQRFEDSDLNILSQMHAEAYAQENDRGELDPRLEIVAAMCELYEPRYAKDLIKTLADGGPTAQIGASVVLGANRAGEAVIPLLAAAKSHDDLVAVAAVYALGQIRDRRAVSALRDLAKAPTVGNQTAGAISDVLGSDFQ